MSQDSSLGYGFSVKVAGNRCREAVCD